MAPSSPSNMRNPSKTSTRGRAHYTGKRFMDDSKSLLTANHLSHETEEKKESITNEALNCIFLQLPQSLLRLDEFLQELVQLEQDYSQKSQSFSPDKYNQLMGNPQDTLLNILKEKEDRDKQKEDQEDGGNKKSKNKIKFDTKKNKRINLLESMCARHFDSKRKTIVEDGDDDKKQKKDPNKKKNEDDDDDDNSTVALKDHVCFTSYSFPEVLNLMPIDSTLPSNEEMINLFDKLRSLFIYLSKNFIKINLGLLLMFPKTEDNEECNLSITVLNKLLKLTSLELIDMQIFRAYIEARAGKIKFVCSYPHFGEAQRILFQYDWDVVFTLTLMIRDLITQCAILYDSLIKNFDAIIKVKEQCNKGRHTGANNNDNNNKDNKDEDSHNTGNDNDSRGNKQNYRDDLTDKNSNIYS